MKEMCIRDRVIAVRQAVANAADRELPVARAHIGPSRPFAAAIVVDGVDIIITRDQIALEHGLAGSRRQVPPAFGGPAVSVLIADRDADPARRVVAEPEIGRGRPRRSGQSERHDEAHRQRIQRFPKRSRVAHFRFRFRPKTDSSQSSWPVNDDGTEVGDVGECRARDEKVADAVEKPR